MRADLSPSTVSLPAGSTTTATLEITNDSDVIEGYTLEVLGLDPSWVTFDDESLSLFPGDNGAVDLQIDLPASFPSGQRQMIVQVTSRVDPARFTLVPLDLDVAPEQRATVLVDPVSTTGGARTDFNVVVANAGNRAIDVKPIATDEEELLDFAFDPAVLRLQPGTEEIVVARAQGPRPWFGTPASRVVTFSLDGLEQPPEVMATFQQRPRIGRWLLALVGLLAAATIFGVVILQSLQAVIDETSVDQDLLETAIDQAAEPEDGLIPADPETIVGNVAVQFGETVTPVDGVTVNLFAADQPLVPVASAATDENGDYELTGLSPGEYKLQLVGAGFEETWFPDQPTFDSAAVIEPGGDPLPPLSVGGRPGTVRGQLVVDDPTGAVATLFVPGSVADQALVLEQNVSADGSFFFEEVPAPVTYDLVVTKTGFATETRTVRVGAAEDVRDIEIVLREGDGIISGTVLGDGGPLGGVQIEIESGSGSLSTVSLTEADSVGEFAVRNLDTAESYTLTFSKAGFASESLTVNLAPENPTRTLTALLSPNIGTISGLVNARTLSSTGSLVEAPAGGVTVTVTDGELTRTTQTVSTGSLGTFLVDDLPVPGTYTVTFSRPDLVSQVRQVDIDAALGSPQVTGIDATLERATALVRGVVTDEAGAPIGGAEVEMTDGTNTFLLRTADVPSADSGRFEISIVPPGTYTLTASRVGTTPETALFTVNPGDEQDVTLVLQQQASITGRVQRSDFGRVTNFAGATVTLFRENDFPSGPSVAQVTADAAGVFVFPALDAPESYVIRVSAGPEGATLGSTQTQINTSEQLDIGVITVVVDEEQ